MKKIVLLLIVFLSIALLGCSELEESPTDTEKSSTPIYQFNENEDYTINFDLIRNESAEDSGGKAYFSNEQYSSAFEHIEFIDDTVSKEKDFTILSNTYVGAYKNSCHIGTCDLTVHVYTLQGCKDAEVFIDAASGKVIKGVFIPFENKLNTEEEYKAFVKQFIAPLFELSNYRYSCFTRYRISGENAVEFTSSNDFHVCTENETWSWYTLKWFKYFGGISTNDHISVTFREDSLSFEIYDLGYTEETFKHITAKKDEITSAFEQNMRDKIKSQYPITKTEAVSSYLFVKNGMPYVSMTNVIYISKELEGEPFEVPISVNSVCSITNSKTE